MIYKCCFSGCHTVDVGEHDATPRHQHGKTFVEMRNPVDVGSLFYNIKPSELKASGGEAAFGD